MVVLDENLPIGAGLGVLEGAGRRRAVVIVGRALVGAPGEVAAGETSEWVDAAVGADNVEAGLLCAARGRGGTPSA